MVNLNNVSTAEGSEKLCSYPVCFVIIGSRRHRYTLLLHVILSRCDCRFILLVEPLGVVTVTHLFNYILQWTVLLLVVPTICVLFDYSNAMQAE